MLPIAMHRHVAALLLGASLAASLATPAQLSPFVLPWNDTAPGITDLSSWNQPIGPQDRVTISDDGHFHLRGERVRFLGINFAGDSPFMPTNKADGVAGRLAKFGVNSVRFHHMDAPWATGGGLLRYTATNSRDFQTAQLDRLHYLVTALARHGIHANINLLVGREYRSGDGLGPEITTMDWKDQHLLGLFNTNALQLHREYATRLLGATNRFSGLPLAHDPAVAMVEILNENGFLQKWYEGALDRLPTRYAADLQSRWNQWLNQSYVSESQLLEAWQAVDQPLGTNLVRNGLFTSTTSPWILEQHSGAAAQITRVADPDLTSAARLTVSRAGTASWHVQFNQPGLRLIGGQVYTLTFSARASRPRPLDVSVMMAHDPWQPLGLSETVNLTTQWQTFTRTFLATATDPQSRVNFGGLGTSLDTVWFADVRLQPGGQVGLLPPGAALATHSIPNIHHGGEGFTGTAAARRDWIRFGLDLENAYYDAMVHHLRHDLGYPGIIFGTIHANSPPAVQSRLDVIDAHAYWQHPVFPGTAWDPNNWYVNNVSLVNQAPADTTLAGLARQRLRGKPFTITEYQHPSPNDFGAEGPLLLAAYAALQDWDGLWLFDYGPGHDAAGAGRFRSYFDMAQHPTKMANLQLATSLFRRGDVQPATHEVITALTPDRELEVLQQRSSSWNIFSSSHLDVPGALALVHRLSVDYRTNAVSTPLPPSPPAQPASDTGELRWHTSTTRGYVTAHTPRTRLAAGFIPGRTVTLGDVTFEVTGAQRDWATVGLTLANDASFAEGGHALLILTGVCENTGQQWKSNARDSLTSWGSAPTLVETVAARITLPVPFNRVQAWILDERGQRRAPATVQANPDGQAVLVTQPADATLWYEILIAAPSQTSFPNWQQQHFSPAELENPAISGPDADPDGIGLSNLARYALGLPARGPVDAALRPSWGWTNLTTAPRFWIHYPQRKNLPDVDLEPWSTRSLPQWEPVTPVTLQDHGDHQWLRAEINATSPTPTDPADPSTLSLGLLQLLVRRHSPTP